MSVMRSRFKTLHTSFLFSVLGLASVIGACGQGAGQSSISTASLQPPATASAVVTPLVLRDIGPNHERAAHIPGAPPPGRWVVSNRGTAIGSTASGTAGAPSGAAIGKGSVAQPTGTSPFVEVKEGDTLYSIAKQHRVTVASLVDANRLSRLTIVPSQRLVVPLPAR
jgi:LysM repeat protein